MTPLRASGFAGLKPANARDITAAMAAHLVEVGIPATEREALRILCAHGFRYGDVLVLADDALVEARQAAVAAAMADPAPPASMAVPNTAASPASPPRRLLSPEPSIKPETGGGSHGC